MILSASRRTDIPAFYSEWMMNRLKEGYVHTKNPMNPSQIKRIELSPEVIDCIVFWTKDPSPMLSRLSELNAMGYRYYFQFSLTPYGWNIEHYLRDKKEMVHIFRRLSDIIGKERVIWRYDPILLNQEITVQYHVKCFEYLCNELKEATSNCTISFIDIYSKLHKAVQKNIIRELSREEMNQLAGDFSEISNKYKINLRACSEKIDLSRYGIFPAACIDRSLIEKICGYSIEIKKDRNQRTGCGCIQSTDIGIYNTCRNGCIYCYANYSEVSIMKNQERHDSNASILIGNIEM